MSSPEFFPKTSSVWCRRFSSQGHVVGMTGDGVNDAPALKQAEAGIAVSTATDVAKAAASIVLTQNGLMGVLRAVETGREIYQRMLTYTLNKIIKTLEIGIFLSVGLILTRIFVITPLLVVLLLFTNDFVTMSIATDRVSISSQPDRWEVRTLMFTAGALAQTCSDSFLRSFFRRSRHSSSSASATPDTGFPHAGFHWPRQRLFGAGARSSLAFATESLADLELDD